MRSPTLQLTHPEATRARLMALAKDIPGAWIGVKIAALLLILEGQRPGWITEVLGLTRMSLSRWMHGVNAAGLHALQPKRRPGRPARLTPQVRQALAAHLEQPPQAFGLPRVQWDGPTLVVHLKRQFGIALKVRQAQMWMHQLGYRLKRASHAYLQARTAEAQSFQRALKKTRGAGTAGDRRPARGMRLGSPCTRAWAGAGPNGDSACGSPPPASTGSGSISPGGWRHCWDATAW